MTRRLSNKGFVKTVQKLTIIKIETGNESLINELYIDSLSIIALITDIEKKYHISIPDELLSVDTSITVNELYELIKKEE